MAGYISNMSDLTGNASDVGDEVVQEAQPGDTALVGMELSGHELVADDDTGEIKGVVRGARHDVTGGDRTVVGVHEVKIRAVVDAVKQRMLPMLWSVVDLVPADLRYFMRIWEALNVTGDYSKTGVWPKLLAGLAEYLHADADA